MKPDRRGTGSFAWPAAGAAGPWLAAAGIAAACFWIYSPAITGGRLWDDNLEIFQNPLLRTPAGLMQAWLAPQGADYLPVKNLIEWGMWHVWHANVVGYHLAGIVLHLTNSFLLWRLLRLFGAKAPWLAALLFAVHPLAVESVAWISELKNTLSLPLLLLSFIAFVSSETKRDQAPSRVSHWRYLVSLLLFVGALLTKSSAVMFPIVLVLYRFWREGRIDGRDLGRIAPFMAASLALGLVTVHFQVTRAIGDLAIPMDAPVARFGAAGRAILFYALKCVFPSPLSPVYPRWESSSAAALVIAPWIPIAAFAAWAWQFRAGWGRPALFAAGCFIVNLVPVLGFLPMSYLRISRVSDHLAYLSLACACGAAAAAAGWAGEAAFRRPVGLAVRGLPASVAGAVVAAAAVLAIQSRAYAAVFRDPTALWGRAVEQSPGSWFAQNNLGSALLQAGRDADALEHLEAARRLNPRAAEVFVNLGDVLLKLGRVPDAVAAERTAVGLEPDFSSAHYNLANALAASGNMRDAVFQYQEAVRLEPDSAEIRYNYGTALAESERLPEASAQLAEAVRLNPEAVRARINFGNILAATGRLPDAIAQFEAALRLQPRDADANFGLADALAAAGRIPEALTHYEAALRERPDDPAIRAAAVAAKIGLPR